jgi:CheY-like chemotaxis protein
MRGYCPACGITVEGDVSFEEGNQIFRCSNCTFPITEETKKASAAAKPAAVMQEAPTVETAKQMLAEMMGEAAGPSKVLFHTIVIAEDSNTLRQVLKIALEKHRISDDIQLTENGEQFVQAVAEKLSTGSLIDLVILDVEMPVLNGYCAAIVLRALERALGITSKVPILFFSGRVCDATFKSALDYCQPARYLNKGVGTASIEQMAVRLARVLSTLKKPAA